MKIYFVIAAYLLAAIAANLTVTHFGPTALYFTSFFLIAIDLTARDVMHEHWKNQDAMLVFKIGAVITVGSILSFLVNFDSLNVATASFSAFVISALIDTTVYEILINKKPMIKMNVSNVFSAIADSIVFPLIAFGGFDAIFSAKQAALKILGGLFWSFLITKFLYKVVKKHRSSYSQSNWKKRLS